MTEENSSLKNDNEMTSMLPNVREVNNNLKNKLLYNVRILFTFV